MAFQARDYLAPRYWPTWLGFGCFWLLTRLPYPAVMRISRGLGLLTYSLLSSRRRITLTNLRLAFPALSEKEHKTLAQDAFRHVGMAMGETAWTWFRSVDQIGPVEITGTEYVDAALAKGKGVILLQAHFTLLELCAAVVGIRWPMRAVYDPPKNPLFAAFLLHQRNRHMEGMIDNRGIREMVRRLRAGEIVWYSPDQSVSVSHGGVPTRYFDQPVLTTSGTARIMRMTGATIIPFIPERKPNGGGYSFRFQPPVVLESDDLVEATQQVNDFLEAQVRTQPEQYLWAHKRFKPPSLEHTDPYR